PIFNDFSLQIDQGSLFGLLGPNGAGKTSLISLIAGLYSPSNGEIKIADKLFSDSKDQILQTIALVPQEYAFYGQLTAHENLRFFARLYPQNKDSQRISKIVDKTIELTGIAEYKHRKASTFSGGLKRRLNLAIGLLNDPQLLILDEPTVGIDPQSRHFILQAIQELNAQGTTILYTSHYMTEIEQLCNDIAIIDHGKILRQGTLEDFLGDSLAIDIRFNRSLNGLTLPEEILSYFKQHDFIVSDAKLSNARFNATQLPELMSALKPLEALDVSIDRINYGAQTLEDVFFELTNTTLRD
ncbi:UNVERIFIED_CONTAM: hypothetical protein GTU68_017739, partial [Idotea baltica]|nr:hypothetical protein [Idotea baltica]